MKNWTRDGLFMNEQDLSELYTYLELFHKVYSVCEGEAQSLMSAIRELYMYQTGEKDDGVVFRALRNPRNAGRKKTITSEECAYVRELRETGATIREIAGKTGISKSSVQRILSPQSRI